MSKFSRFLHHLFGKIQVYAGDVYTSSALLDALMMHIENAKARAKIILATPDLTDDQKLVELDKLLLDITNRVQSAIIQLRTILHNQPGI